MREIQCAATRNAFHYPGDADGRGDANPLRAHRSIFSTKASWEAIVAGYEPIAPIPVNYFWSRAWCLPRRSDAAGAYRLLAAGLL